MFPSFDELAPLFQFMLNHGSVSVFMTNLCANTDCIIPTIPRLHCDSASVHVNHMDVLTDCCGITDNGTTRIKHVTLKTSYCTFRIDYVKQRAILKTRSIGLIDTYRRLTNQVGLPLHVVMPPQN